MTGRGVDRFGVARGRAVAAAVVRSAEMRAALEHLAGNADVRLAGIVALLLVSAARILWDAARLRRVRLMLGRVPVAGPFPDVADYIADAMAVRRKGGHRRGAVVAVGFEVLVREIALPGVRQVLAVGRELITPGEVGSVEPAARGEFPFRL